MTKLTKCDNCGTVCGEGAQTFSIHIVPVIASRVPTPFDICSSCVREGLTPLYKREWESQPPKPMRFPWP